MLSAEGKQGNAANPLTATVNRPNAWSLRSAIFAYSTDPGDDGQRLGYTSC